MKRLSFLKHLGLGASASALIGCYRPQKNNAPDTSAKLSLPNKPGTPTYEWKMVTTWPPGFPILGTMCQEYADWVSAMTAGSMHIEIYGGGELVPALEVFDAVSNGVVQMGHGASYYWAGKVPAAQFFSSVPFGMNAMQQTAWINEAGGMDLYRELYEPFGILPYVAGNTNAQMGGWFNKEINTIQDIQGLKMRMPGLGGRILSRAGGTPILSPGGEIYTNLERGVIDATEWIGPYHDYIMGFHEIAKYYYAPGWHETGSSLELLFHKASFESLPTYMQHVLATATYRLHQSIAEQMEVMNSLYLQKLKDEGIALRTFPETVLRALKTITRETLEDLAGQDETIRKVYSSYDEYRMQSDQLYDITEKILRNI